jgi:hypothetical protein
LDKFATALGLRWPWLEWKDDSKIWAGTGNPCNENDMEIFYAATTITLGNGRKTHFWQAPWLEGKMPKNIAPKIYEICKRKNWKVSQALQDDEWIRKLSGEATLSIEHLTQFVQLWALIQNVHLDEHVEDDIVWKLTGNGQYSAASAYKLQFFGLIESSMYKLIWKAWAPPKAKNHACLSFKIDFGRRINCGSGGGTILGFASFASKSKRATTTFSSIAASPSVFGSN